jgi:hypothetical protein
MGVAALAELDAARLARIKQVLLLQGVVVAVVLRGGGGTLPPHLAMDATILHNLPRRLCDPPVLVSCLRRRRSVLAEEALRVGGLAPTVSLVVAALPLSDAARLTGASGI